MKLQIKWERNLFFLIITEVYNCINTQGLFFEDFDHSLIILFVLYEVP